MFRTMLLGASLSLLLACSGNAGLAADQPPKPVDVKDVATRVSGPYVHDNLTVFLLHAKEQDQHEYLTLDQGLDRKLVVVSEKDREQVSELLIENKSDKYLFLQEGDRLQGGKQDRIIITSLVVPPRSGKMPVPSFCIEQSRWQLSARGNSFANTSNTIYAPQSVRAAAKAIPSRGGQQAVWQEVAKLKVEANAKLGSSNLNSSLNETLDSAQVKKICDACAKALNDVPAKHPDAIGVALAVNGKVEEVNLYPNATLFRQLYPRLVQSYAMQAALEKDKLKGKPAPAVAATDVQKFMAASKEKGQRFEDINRDNRIRIREVDTRLECVTAYQGQAVHRQWLNKAAVPMVPNQGPQQRINDNINRNPQAPPRPPRP